MLQNSESEIPRCSVICTTYNHAKYSKIALESVFAQDYENIEIVVVDDGSSDGNPEVLREVLGGSPFPYKLIEQENTGNVPLNVNRGIAAASGDYLSFLSLDDLMLPNTLSRKMKIVRDTPLCVLVADTVWQEIDGDGTVTAPRVEGPAFQKQIRSATELLEIEYQNIGSFFIQATIMRTDVVRGFGALDTDISGDDIILRTKIFMHIEKHEGLTFKLMDQVGMAYRKHNSNLHLNSYNQIKTVVDWHGRYFSDRPLPELALTWIDHTLMKCYSENDSATLRRLVKLHPAVAARRKFLTGSWKFQRRRAKGWIRSSFRKLLSRND